MSIRWMTHVWERSPYKGATLMIHIALADNANDAGECWPHLPTILRKARCSRASGYAALRQMQADGLLKYEGEEVCRPSQDCPLILLPVQNLDAAVQDLDAPVQILDAEASHTSLIRTVREPSSNRARAVTSVTSDDAGFEYWWGLYPKRVGKGSARLAFTKALKKVDLGKLNEATEAYAAYRRGKDKTYTLNPTTWLNRESWEDELPGSAVGVLPDAPVPEWYQKVLDRRKEER